MKHSLIFFIAVVSLLSCSRKINTIQIDGREVRPEAPPNCVKIRDNFYADQTEVGNVHYREYFYWIQRVYGENSQKSRNLIPVLLEWNDSLLLKNLLFEYYFRHPVFNDYPVVGISYDEAANYCSWRSDMAYEGMLVREKIIRKGFIGDSSSCFTIERYQAGNFLNYKPDKKILIPRFRLPTESEWELIAGGGLNLDEHPLGLDSSSKQVIHFMKKNSFLYNTKEILTFYDKDSGYTDITSRTVSFTTNNYGLFNTIGNVAEMVTEKGIAKGGSWQQSLKECEIRKRINYSAPTSWLGFRCVCTWEVPK